MKLLRLLTTSSSAKFENTFDEDIILEPNSKIGLVNLSLTPRQTIEIDNSNNTLQFLTVTDTPAQRATRLRTVTLNNGNYTRNDFLEEMNRAMNSALELVGNEKGFQWKTVIADDKIKIQFNRSGGTKPNFPEGNKNNITVSGNGGEISATTNPASNFGAYCYSQSLFIKGCGLIKGRLQNKGTDPFIMGLYQNDSLDAPTDSNCSFGIIGNYYIDGTHTAAYAMIINGEIFYDQNNIVDTEADDYITLELFQGKLVATVYKLGAYNTPLDVWETEFNYNTDYHCAFCLSDGTIQIRSIIWSKDPFVKEDLNGVSKVEEIDDDNNYSISEPLIEDSSPLGVPQPATPNASQVSIFFTNKNLKELLGYLNNQYTKNLVKGDFHAELSFLLTIHPESILVEIPSLKLDSYDGSNTQRKRRNILAVIPTPVINPLSLTYQTDNPLMINIKNTSAITLRNITVKFTTLNDEPIFLEEGSGASLTVVVE